MFDVWDVLWGAWILLFVGLEAAALVRKKRGDTLSENVWQWFSLRGDSSQLSRVQAGLRFGFLAFWAWLTIHFLSGGAWL